MPSAAAVQRALAAVGDKKLPSPTTPQFSPDSLEPRKTARATAPGTASQARVTSPPSVTRQQPIIPASLNLPKPVSAIGTIQEEVDNATESRYPTRSSVGSKLETVQEDSPVQTPAMSESILAAQRPSTIQEDPDEDNPDMTSSQTTSGTRSSTTTAEHGSGSDDAASRRNKGKEQSRSKELEKSIEVQKAPASASASRKPSINQLTPKPPAVQPRKSFQHLNPARNKEGSVKSMTVETETVSNPDLIADREGRSISGRLDGSGSIRTKASTETIRPKRDRKRVRKTHNIANGPASSKADIFEARVASAVDEAANSSDSEETFVYESNPPEPRSSHRSQHGGRYHHSRTPSAASMASQSTDNYRSNHFGVAGKKSMKFVNANQLRDPDDEDSAYYPSNTARSSHRHHHHLARLNRLPNQPNDSESPASSMRSPRTRQFNSWRTHGHRPVPDSENIMSAMADKPQNTSMYDLSHGAEADDEFTPLMNNRNGRNDARLRRGRMSRAESYQRTPFRTFASCAKYTCVSLLMGAVVALIVIALVLCNRTLFDIKVTQVRNVLASEQELFLEFAVTARNPNLVDVSVGEGDLDLFAKSKYVGTTEMWRDGTIPGIEEAGNDTKALQFVPDDNVDDGTDPIEEPGSGTHTMLLGKVTDLESPLVFASSPFNHELRHSVAGLRLGKPGNKTEEGGSRRWENVMQHPFELVVRGRLRYYLPLSSKERYMPITASTTVIPDKPIDVDDPKRNDTMKIRTKQTPIKVKLGKVWTA